MTIFGDWIYYMGVAINSSDGIRLYRRSLQQDGLNQYLASIPGLNGDIAIADYNNDGFADMVITGENELFQSITKLYNGVPDDNNSTHGFIENTDISLIGLKESTAAWIDYDTDGDLDLFLNGIDNDGVEQILLYKTNLENKTNSPAPAITNLSFESLGNGMVRLSWDEPIDDNSDNLGYIIRLGTSEFGSELSNTESNLDTGERLITKFPKLLPPPMSFIGSG